MNFCNCRLAIGLPEVAYNRVAHFSWLTPAQFSTFGFPASEADIRRPDVKRHELLSLMVLLRT